MLRDWFNRKVQLATAKGAREDIERFVESLRGQSAEEIGAVVAMASIVRVALRKSDLLPDELVQLTSDPKQAVAQLAVSQLIGRYQREKRYGEATGAMVWLHTLRALSVPEIRLLGREMWRQLERGREQALTVFQEMGIPPLSDVTYESSQTPEDLEPMK
jgi:hypothetical protein